MLPASKGEQRAPVGGNPCKLVMSHVPPGELAHSAGGTVCQSWPVACDKGQVIAVRCYTTGGELIQCCGHGLLAAAHGWQRRLDSDRLTLDMNGSLVASWRQNERTWLRFNRLSTEPCPVPSWVGEVFEGQQQPEAAAICGGSEGYLVLEWSENFDMHELSPSGSRLSAHTGRAMICTAAHTLEGDGAIQLRYFAPQYGVPEDDATGSAMRVLAEYWSPRFVELNARQCSPGGGWLLACWTPDHVDVGGYCMDVEVAVAHA